MSSTDCLNVFNLAKGLNLGAFNATMLNVVENDCCQVVTCDENFRVTKISWNGLGLNGTLDGAYLPSSLKSLYLYYNKITGSIPSQLPTNMTMFDLYSNSLTGQIPTGLPESLLYFIVSSNKLSGPIPTLPVGLKGFHVNDNQLTGSIPDPLPTGLTELSLNGNLMTGPIPTLPSTIQYLYLGYEWSLPGNEFTGALTVNKPLALFINDNYISSVTITDSSALTSGNCDLSNNPLLDDFRISSLSSVCVQLNLFSLPGTFNSNLASSTIAPQIASSATSPHPTIADIASATSSKSTNAPFNPDAPATVTPPGAIAAVCVLVVFILLLVAGVLRMSRKGNNPKTKQIEP